jgi:hypothetical protein
VIREIGRLKEIKKKKKKKKMEWVWGLDVEKGLWF